MTINVMKIIIIYDICIIYDYNDHKIYKLGYNKSIAKSF